jgi:putative spermidine/putrescine transport system substrate-binding protein
MIPSLSWASLQDLEKAASKEGRLETATMPDNWANWGETWSDLKKKYGIVQRDTDMSSAEVISKIKAERSNATLDIGDSGLEFASVAKSQSITQPYKPTTWDEIPLWAKDPDGHWMLSYTGTISFIVNKEKVRTIPRSWKELMNGTQKLSIGSVGKGSQPTNAVLAAAIALGGSEKDLMPGINLFSKMAKEKRLVMIAPSVSNLERGEIEVAVLWDFNALNYRNMIGRNKFEVLIPSDGSVISGYSTIINKWAKNPNAAKLAREYILNDSGQINLARGYARPIRPVVLPDEVKRALLPSEQYENARLINDVTAWRKSARKLPYLWQDFVLVHLD